MLDATRPPAELSREIQGRVRELLPDPVPFAAEENTGSFPAVRRMTAGAVFGDLAGQESVVAQLRAAVAAAASPAAPFLAPAPGSAAAVRRCPGGPPFPAPLRRSSALRSRSP